MSDLIAGRAAAPGKTLKVTVPSSRSHGKQGVIAIARQLVLGRQECVTFLNVTTRQARCLQTTSMKDVVSKFQKSGLIKSREMGQNQLEEHLNGGC
jgi:hypothetical protein